MNIVTKRVVLPCEVSSSGAVKVPRGNILGNFVVTPTNALTPTVQSSVIDLRVTMSIDGVNVPVTVESEQFFMESS